MNAHLHPIFVDMLAPHLAPRSWDAPRAKVVVCFPVFADPERKHWLADLAATVTIYRTNGDWQADSVALHTEVEVPGTNKTKSAKFEVEVGPHAPHDPMAEMAVVELMQPQYADRIEAALAKADAERRAVA